MGNLTPKKIALETKNNCEKTCTIQELFVPLQQSCKNDIEQRKTRIKEKFLRKRKLFYNLKIFNFMTLKVKAVERKKKFTKDENDPGVYRYVMSPELYIALSQA